MTYLPTGFDARAFLAQLTTCPGIYQMFDADGKILYVGKAKSLKNRVSSYFRNSGLSTKTQALVARIADIQVTVTSSETEALLLEQNLIKNERPPYNILLRDDKSYPYIFVSDRDSYPAVCFNRGARHKGGRYFGPFPSSGAVRESLSLLQKIFRVRQCEESFFRNRSRPCLQYQINRCSGPCVEGLVSPEDYARDVRHTTMFLEGKNTAILQELGEAMEQASVALEFEKAAAYRDQISALQKIQEQQYVTGMSGDADVFGIACQPGGVSLHVLFVRAGRVVGSKSIHPKVSVEEAEADILSAFLGQWYFGAQREIPDQVIVSYEMSDSQALAKALMKKHGRKVVVSHNVRGERAGWQRLAQTNARQQLNGWLANKQNVYNRFLALQEVLGLEGPPVRMECFDISHSAGEATVASCVVFDRNGPLKSDYRTFNIKGVTAGDDYAAMRQALERRYTRLKTGEGMLPDILFIDGGKGQVRQATGILELLQITEVLVIGVAKGPNRRAGLEVLIMGESGDDISLAGDSPALHLVQHIRDEAHRFAITGHRARRGKVRKQSRLEEIPGIGPKRRRELLRHFGSIRGIGQASIEEIAKVSTISRTLAEEIYAAFHPEI
ncbi:MAG: excinuclease ABC subunit UvrC [Marinobacterium sp.]|nr:excinuclease ABC subunit UvrC [Marinobacterium sp.]